MTLITTLATASSPDARLPIAIDRDPHMTGGTIAKYRFKSAACYPSQASGDPGTIKDLVSETTVTKNSSGVTWTYTPATGAMNSASEGGSQGLYHQPAVDLYTRNGNEFLIGGWFKPIATSTFARALTRYGEATVSGGALTTAANHLTLQHQNSNYQIYVAGKKAILPVPAVNSTLDQIFCHVMPDAGDGLTTIDVYHGTLADEPEMVGTVTVEYVAFGDLTTPRFSVGLDPGADGIRPYTNIYEAWLEDLTVGGRNAADLVRLDYERNVGVFS